MANTHLASKVLKLNSENSDIKRYWKHRLKAAGFAVKILNDPL